MLQPESEGDIDRAEADGEGRGPIAPASRPRRRGKVFTSVQHFRRLPPPALAALVAATVSREIVTIGFLVAFAHALGLDISVTALGWIGPFIGLALLLPVSFSGLGVREGAFVVLLTPYGISGSSALALAFLMLLAYLLVVGGGGVLELKNLLIGGVRRNGQRPDRPGRNHLPRQTI